ncbi:MAG: LysR family transcriptional regulator [Chitinivorax sp.]
MRGITIRQLQIFAEAAKQRSFARVAENLHISAAGVSLQIKQIEQLAGLQLFERLGQHTDLTEAGEVLLRYSHTILQALHDADEALSVLKGLRGGRVRLGVLSTAKYFAPRIISHFRSLYPGVQVSLAVSNREAIVQQLEHNDIDLAIMGRPPQGLDTIGQPFAQHPLVIVSHPRHPLAQQAQIEPQQLAGEPFLVRESGSGTRTAMEQFFAEREVKIHIDMVLPSNETIKQAVMAGLGLAFISRHTIGLELDGGYLRVLPVSGTPVMREWHLVRRTGKPLTPALQVFEQLLLQSGSQLLGNAIGQR